MSPSGLDISPTQKTTYPMTLERRGKVGTRESGIRDLLPVSLTNNVDAPRREFVIIGSGLPPPFFNVRGDFAPDTRIGKKWFSFWYFGKRVIHS